MYKMVKIDTFIRKITIKNGSVASLIIC